MFFTPKSPPKPGVDCCSSTTNLILVAMGNDEETRGWRPARPACLYEERPLILTHTHTHNEGACQHVNFSVQIDLLGGLGLRPLIRRRSQFQKSVEMRHGIEIGQNTPDASTTFVQSTYTICVTIFFSPQSHATCFPLWNLQENAFYITPTHTMHTHKAHTHTNAHKCIQHFLSIPPFSIPFFLFLALWTGCTYKQRAWERFVIHGRAHPARSVTARHDADDTR